MSLDAWLAASGATSEVEEELQELVDRLDRVSRKYSRVCLKIEIHKVYRGNPLKCDVEYIEIHDIHRLYEIYIASPNCFVIDIMCLLFFCSV